MSDSSRKASDVILELEQKVNVLLEIARSQDLLLKVMSNKINTLMTQLEAKNIANSPPQFKVEAVDAPLPVFTTFGERTMENKQVLIRSEDKIETDNSPQGFRRTSRPETYAGDDAYLKKEAPKQEVSEFIVPDKKKNISPPKEKSLPKGDVKTIPVQQRAVDKNGKSIFLADVEVSKVENNEVIYKTRTNGAGKWMAALSPGNYKIKIKASEALTKEKLVANQEITVNDQGSPLELPMIIIK